MTEKFNFKKETLALLKSQAKQYDVADIKVSGLRLMVNPGGSKTFFLYRKVKGRPQRIKIGRYDIGVENARKEAGRLNSLITLGQPPILSPGFKLQFGAAAASWRGLERKRKPLP